MSLGLFFNFVTKLYDIYMATQGYRSETLKYQSTREAKHECHDQATGVKLIPVGD